MLEAKRGRDPSLQKYLQTDSHDQASVHYVLSALMGGCIEPGKIVIFFYTDPLLPRR